MQVKIKTAWMSGKRRLALVAAMMSALVFTGFTGWGEESGLAGDEAETEGTVAVAAGSQEHETCVGSRDRDYDGFTDEEERRLGTNPRDANSRPTLADNHEKIMAYWPLMTNAVEMLESGLNGALLGGARFRQEALELDGRRAYVNFGSSPALSFWGDFSYCLWLKPKEGHDFARVLGKIRSRTEESEYCLFIGYGGRIWNVLSSDGSLDWDKIILQGTVWSVVKKNKWLHVGVSWCPSRTGTGADGVLMHVNGQRAWTCGFGLDGLTNLYQGSADLMLGTFDVQGAHIEDAFKGSAAQLIFCREVLTDLEMKEIYLLGRDGDLVAYIDRDSDNDGLVDWWERKYFGDVRQNGLTDSDGDGLTNAQEQQLGTNPNLADTDGDGYSDGNEVKAGSDPLDPSSTPAPKKVILEVISAHGSCIPSAGTHEYERGSTVTCYIAESPLTAGSTQYVSTGWTGSGSVPTAGTNLEVTAILQTNSAINWLWTTNYWLGLFSGEHGAVTGTSGWYQAGAIVNISAAADEYWQFAGWSGDVAGLDTNANPLSVLMDQGRNLRARFETTLPPDPVTIAPEVRKGEASILARNISFLYSGENPIQTGADTNAFETKRLAVARGKILDREGLPLPGVTVTIFDHPEYGQTLSRIDGWYDMAVNGGSAVAVDYRKDGYLPARRTIDTAWQNFSVLPEVRLIPTDPVGTVVQFGTGITNAQVAQASEVTDESGPRQATVIVPSGAQAYLVDEAGITQAVSQLTMRFTEYTVGPNGPVCMPEELPSSSFYTYCVELGADEAKGKTIKFDTPVSFYVDNFLGMPVGLNVPTAYYEWKGCPGWMAEPDGIVLQILGTNALGQTEIDLNGDGLAEDEIGLEEWGITSEERTELAKLYAPGKSLWRVQRERFSPLDCNWPVFYVAPEGAKYPEVSVRDQHENVSRESQRNTGGNVGIESGSFNETLPIYGTGYELNYTSGRTPGLRNSLTIFVLGTDVPPSLLWAEVDVDVAGRRWTQTFPALPSETWMFQWDGKDAFGRALAGRQSGRVEVRYIYDGYYGRTPLVNLLAFANYTFALASGVELPGEIRGRSEVALKKEAEITLGGTDGRQWGLGGWMLDIHHSYDPANQILYYGDGRESRADTHTILRCIRTSAGTGNAEYAGDGGLARNAALNQPMDLCSAPDGTLYIADAGNNRIRKISPQGIITTIAGTGTAGYSGDGGLAVNAELNNPVSVAVCAHGVVYISDNGNNVIRKVTPDGIIHTIAGDGTEGYSGAGGPALLAQLNGPMGIAVDKECAVYVADCFNGRVRRIGPDKRINTIAGTGEWNFDGVGDNGPAIDAAFGGPTDVAVSEDGAILVADYLGRRVRRIGNDGIINTIYQAGTPGFGCRTVSAKPGNSSFCVGECHPFAMLPTVVWEVNADGSSKRVAGIFAWDVPLGDGGPATAADLEGTGVCFGPDRVLYIADTNHQRIRSVKLDYPGFSNEEIVIASEDGGEIYVFDAAGRHLRTLDASTRSTLYAFSYTSEGVLSSITDGDGLVTTIERDGSGNPTAIVGPYGHRTEMKLDSSGWLTELTNPAGEKNLMSYTTNGLLTSVVSRRGYEFHQEYDSEGKITGNTDPAGGRNFLAQQELDNGWSVAIADSLGRTNTHIVERQTDGTETRRIIDPAGLEATKTETPEGGVVINQPDGTQITMQQGPEPRFGMQSPIVKRREISTPAHFNALDFERIAGLSDPYDPLSMTNMVEYLTVNGRTWAGQYTVEDRTTVSVTPMGRRSMVKTDTQCRPVYLQMPGVYAVNNEYDAQGRLVQITQGLGADQRTIEFTYNADGYLSSVVNAIGQTVNFEQDNIGRVTNQVRSDGHTIVTRYDRSSKPVALTLPSGMEHGFGHTPVNLTERYTPPDVVPGDDSTCYTYDFARALTSVIRPDGKIITNGYDSAGRPSFIEWPVNRVDYAYDPTSGNLSEITTVHGETLHYIYDGFLLKNVSCSGSIAGSVGFTYDNDFRITELDVNGANAISYQYDDDSLLTSAGALTLIRDLTSGFLTNTTLGSITDSRSFNGFGELSTYSASFSGAEVYSVRYFNDKLGRITNLTETMEGATNTFAYVYDNVGRLIEVSTNGAIHAQYQYDPNGNRTNSIVGGVLRSAAFDAQDRMLSYGSVTYQYNEAGDMINKTDISGTMAYDYDCMGNLLSVTFPSGDQVEYIIDGANRRIGKKVNGTLAQGFLYKDALNPVAELDGAGNIVAVFIYGTRANVPDYMIKGGATYRLITDYLGSVRLVVDADSGEVIQRVDYDVFGRVLQDTNPGFQPFGFAGGLYDQDTGLVRFGARDYDTETGRWTAKDPILFAGGDENLYVYCNDDPINFIDSMGLAYFALRPLGCLPWIPGESHNPIYDYLNTELSHEQIFFEDKRGGNIGFTKEASYGIWGIFGIGPAVIHQETDPVQIAKYHITRKGYNDEILRQAVKNVGISGYNYQLLWFGFGSKFNCQDWAERVRKEYDRLVKKQDFK